MPKVILEINISDKELPTAGCGSLSADEAKELQDHLPPVSPSGKRRAFREGFLCGLAFVCCPEDSDMYGKDITEFEFNGLSCYVIDLVDDIFADMNGEVA